MSTPDFTLNAEKRSLQGKGASRRLRRLDDQIPAIIYGGDKAPEMLSLAHKEVLHALSHEAFYSHILTIKVGSDTEKAIIKDIQRHPFKPKVMHMDFQRVSMTQSIRVQVPVHFLNEDTCPGMKAGGIASHHMTQIEVECLPGKLPQFIEVDMSALELDHAIHLKELKLPEGVDIVELTHFDNDAAVVSVHMPKVIEEPEEAEAEEAAAEGEAAEGEAGGGAAQGDDNKPQES